MKKIVAYSMFSLFFMVLISFNSAYSHEGTFKHQWANSGLLYNENKIRYFIDTEEIGYISITKAPLLPFYILHTLYVHPEQRNKGYGKILLNYACEYAESLGASNVYIQPGPYELDKNGYLIKPAHNYQERFDALIALYQKSGFRLTSKPLIWCARLFYMCMHIDENAEYLMVKI